MLSLLEEARWAEEKVELERARILRDAYDKKVDRDLNELASAMTSMTIPEFLDATICLRPADLGRIFPDKAKRAALEMVIGSMVIRSTDR